MSSIVVQRKGVGDKEWKRSIKLDFGRVAVVNITYEGFKVLYTPVGLPPKDFDVAHSQNFLFDEWDLIIDDMPFERPPEKCKDPMNPEFWKDRIKVTLDKESSKLTIVMVIPQDIFYEFPMIVTGLEVEGNVEVEGDIVIDENEEDRHG